MICARASITLHFSTQDTNILPGPSYLGWAFNFARRASVFDKTVSSSQIYVTLSCAIVAAAHFEKFGRLSRPVWIDSGKKRPFFENAYMRRTNGATRA